VWRPPPQREMLVVSRDCGVYGLEAAPYEAVARGEDRWWNWLQQRVLVVEGELLTAEARRTRGNPCLPIDSEHKPSTGVCAAAEGRGRGIWRTAFRGGTFLKTPESGICLNTYCSRRQ